MKIFLILVIFICTSHAIPRAPRPAPRPTQKPAKKSALFRGPPKSPIRVPEVTTFKPTPNISGITSYRPVPSLKPQFKSGKDSTGSLRVSLYNISVEYMKSGPKHGNISKTPSIHQNLEDQLDLIDMKVQKVV